MYFIDFKISNSPEPLKEFELCLGGTGIGIFWPTKKVHAFEREEIKTSYGIDVEAEAIKEITDELCEAFAPLAFDYERTRLEVALAIGRVFKLKRQQAQSIQRELNQFRDFIKQPVS